MTLVFHNQFNLAIETIYVCYYMHLGFATFMCCSLLFSDASLEQQNFRTMFPINIFEINVWWDGRDRFHKIEHPRTFQNVPR